MLGNAFKFSHPDTTVTLSVYNEADTIIFSVTDQGQGIKPEDLPRVIWQRLPGNPTGTPPNYKEYESRSAAERALYKALLLLDRLDA